MLRCGIAAAVVAGCRGGVVFGDLRAGLLTSIDSLLPNFESKLMLILPLPVTSRTVLILKTGPADYCQYTYRRWVKRTCDVFSMLDTEITCHEAVCSQ